MTNAEQLYETFGCDHRFKCHIGTSKYDGAWYAYVVQHETGTPTIMESNLYDNIHAAINEARDWAREHNFHILWTDF